jgi:hypothetical protein
VESKIDPVLKAKLEVGPQWRAVYMMREVGRVATFREAYEILDNHMMANGKKVVGSPFLTYPHPGCYIASIPNPKEYLSYIKARFIVEECSKAVAELADSLQGYGTKRKPCDCGACTKARDLVRKSDPNADIEGVKQKVCHKCYYRTDEDEGVVCLHKEGPNLHQKGVLSKVWECRRKRTRHLDWCTYKCTCGLEANMITGEVI